MPLLHAALALLLAYTGFCVVYALVFAVAGKLRPLPPERPTGRLRRVVVLLPAYREDAVILDSAAAALRQTYPRSHYDVVVIADSLQPGTVKRLRETPGLVVVPVKFDVSTKAKALWAALDQLPDVYDAAVVLDADNHMALDCLFHLLGPFDRGFRAVQGHRVAKNLNTPVAVLDAVSEEINNHIYRKGHRALGLSSALIGSGMAFEYRLLKQILPRVQVVSGFDKEMEMVLLRQRVRVDYVERALIYDEKVQNEAVFEKQRTRWLAAQFRVMHQNLLPGFAALLRGNVDYFDKVLQALLLPRLLLLGTLTGLSALLVLVGAFTPGLLAAGQLALLLLTFYLSVPERLRVLLGWKEVRKLPLLFFRFARSLFKIGQAKEKFLHTPHGTDEVRVG